MTVLVQKYMETVCRSQTLIRERKTREHMTCVLYVLKSLIKIYNTPAALLGLYSCLRFDDALWERRTSWT